MEPLNYLYFINRARHIKTSTNHPNLFIKTVSYKLTRKGSNPAHSAAIKLNLLPKTPNIRPI